MTPPRRAATALTLTVTLVALAGCSSSGGETTPAAAPVPSSGSPSSPGATSPGVSAAPSVSASPGASTAGSGRATATANPWGHVTRASDVATGLRVPWSIVFLPDGTALTGERPTGRVFALRPGVRPRQVADLPTVAAGEGGLLSLAVSPSYASDGLVYAYYTAKDDNRIVRFRLGAAPAVVLSGIPKGPIHDGGRLGFGPDGMLYVGTGETGDRGLAQDRTSLGGKILRLRPDGSVPDDNPFAGSPVWSYGHRNVQGLAWDQQGRMYATEFGQNTYDEVNLIRPGANYGWPVVEGQARRAGYVDPIVIWPTDEASPSGMAYAAGSLYVAALRGERLWRVGLDGRGGATGSTPLLRGTYGRLRAATLGPDGSLWIGTSNQDGRGRPHGGDDRILRVPLATLHQQ